MNYSTQFLNKIVTVKMDRPMGTRHPRIHEIYYIQNYGYIPEVKAPDGEEYSDEQIKSLTEFQERFYKSVIVRP